MEKQPEENDSIDAKKPYSRSSKPKSTNDLQLHATTFQQGVPKACFGIPLFQKWLSE
jgi:hypothetical protein